MATNSKQTPPSLKRSLNRAAAVITAWLQDDEFVDSKKEPKVLPIHGESGSFQQLVTRFGGNVTMGSILDELERIEAVTRPTKDTVQLCSRGYIPQQDDSEQIEIASMCTADLLGTAVHNMESEKAEAHFQRQVVHYQVPDDLAEKFKQYSNEKSMQLLIDYNEWLTRHIKQQSVAETENAASKRLGVGIYYFENDVARENDNEL